jgi:hypothetical protein
LDDDAIDLASIEVDHVLHLSLRFFGAGPLHFEELEVSDTGDRNDCQDDSRLPVHIRRAVATTLWFRWRQESVA